MKTLTVFTPTYNRAYCLHHLYDSLCSQTSKDFIWLVIDDGSSDNTKSLVQSWMKKNIIKIEYIYKENGGMHTAHNVAYDNIETELNVCIDSDDQMPVIAVESILRCWSSISDKSKIVGMVGLDVDLKGNLIGSKLPNQIKTTKFHLLYQRYGVTGDKKVVLKTALIDESLRYPEYENEKLVPLGYMYNELDKKYDFACFNEVWAQVDYQNDGSSATINNQYYISPKGFRFAKAKQYENSTVTKYRVKALIHYGFTSIILRDYLFFTKSPNPLLSITLSPFSLAFYIQSRAKKAIHTLHQ